MTYPETLVTSFELPIPPFSDKRTFKQFNNCKGSILGCKKDFLLLDCLFIYCCLADVFVIADG